MTVNGKRNNFTLKELIDFGVSLTLVRPKDIINEVIVAVIGWPEFAKHAYITQDVSLNTGKYHRISF